MTWSPGRNQLLWKISSQQQDVPQRELLKIWNHLLYIKVTENSALSLCSLIRTSGENRIGERLQPRTPIKFLKKSGPKCSPGPLFFRTVSLFCAKIPSTKVTCSISIYLPWHAKQRHRAPATFGSRIVFQTASIGSGASGDMLLSGRVFWTPSSTETPQKSNWNDLRRRFSFFFFISYLQKIQSSKIASFYLHHLETPGFHHIFLTRVMSHDDPIHPNPPNRHLGNGSDKGRLQFDWSTWIMRIGTRLGVLTGFCWMVHGGVLEKCSPPPF